MITPSDRQAPPTASPDGKASLFQTASTHDIDEQAALLDGWNQTYDQMSGGPFNGSFVEAELDVVQIFREITSNALHQSGALPAGTIAIGVPIALLGNATFCGTPANGTQLHVFSGRDTFEFLSPSGLDIAGFVLRERDFAGALTHDEMETVLPSLSRPHLRPADGNAVARMRQLFADVCEVLSQGQDIAADPARVASMARDVTAALVAALSHPPAVSQSQGDRLDIPPVRRSRIVRDARDLVTQWPDGYTSVEELCRTLGVSRRALQYSFQETLGLKPATYLRAVRMNGARRAIREARSVAEAATLWGFWHFGRFARDYRTMFGELPSETFRRHHGPCTTESA